MHLGSIYLIVSDYEKSLSFYEQLLEMKVSAHNSNRFAMFNFEGHCIALLNGYYDLQNPDKVVRKGEHVPYFDDSNRIAQLPNSRKAVLNFWVEDLRKEYERILKIDISDNLTKVRYICNASPYYYFHLTDPDGNIIEVTGEYEPEEGEL